MVCIGELLLLQCYVSEAPPCIIMGLVCFEGILIALLSILKVFVGDELVPAEGVRICEVLIQLNGSSEEFESRLMFFLQTVAVTDDTPGFRRKQGFLECKVA